MNSYRLYFITNGRIDGVLPFEADDDAAALAVVTDRRLGRPPELWNLNRLVQRLTGMAWRRRAASRFPGR